MKRRDFIQIGAAAGAGIVATNLSLAHASSITAAGSQPAARCPICGCEAHHCDAGVPKHLKCTLQTIDEQLRIKARLETFNNAEMTALRPTTSLCNELVGMMAELLGFKGFHVRQGTYPYMSANDITDFLESGGGDSAGWRRVSGDEVIQHADVGQLVVGVINGSVMGRDHGHTFVVLPGSTSTDSPGRGLKILDASYDAKIPTEETLSKAIKVEYQNSVQYYAFMRR
jgi:hypothetical protein